MSPNGTGFLPPYSSGKWYFYLLILCWFYLFIFFSLFLLFLVHIYFNRSFRQRDSLEILGSGAGALFSSESKSSRTLIKEGPSYVSGLKT